MSDEFQAHFNEFWKLPLKASHKGCRKDSVSIPEGLRMPTKQIIGASLKHSEIIPENF